MRPVSVVGIVPAAGHATRLGLATGSKEALAVRDRPLIEYLVERMQLAGVDRLRVVTRPAKTDLIDLARSLGAEILLGEPRTVGQSFALGITGLEPGDIVLFGFPDTIWSPTGGFVALRELVESGEPIAAGIFESPHPHRSDVAVLDAGDRLVGIEVKPANPSSHLVYACLAARVAALDGIAEYDEPGAFLAASARHRPIATARLGRVIDLGTPEALAAAATDPVWEAS